LGLRRSNAVPTPAAAAAVPETTPTGSVAVVCP
jgi:hypothetical protein